MKLFLMLFFFLKLFGGFEWKLDLLMFLFFSKSFFLFWLFSDSDFILSILFVKVLVMMLTVSLFLLYLSVFLSFLCLLLMEFNNITVNWFFESFLLQLLSFWVSFVNLFKFFLSLSEGFILKEKNCFSSKYLFGTVLGLYLVFNLVYNFSAVLVFLMVFIMLSESYSKMVFYVIFFSSVFLVTVMLSGQVLLSVLVYFNCIKMVLIFWF